MRRSLSAGTGRIKSGGEVTAAARLAAALSAGASDDGRAHLHGFHTYPARLSPQLVATLLKAAPPGGTVLDPFAGSGTTLVEANLLGFAAVGVDANPLAVRLAALKTRVTTNAEIETIIEAAAAVSDRAHERARKRKRTIDSGEMFDDPTAFQPHVFRELVGLREEIAVVEPERIREALLLIFSAIVVKFSKQRADTRPADAPPDLPTRQVGRGVPSKFFLRKAEELGRALAYFANARRSSKIHVSIGDARKLKGIDDHSIDVVISSPPYVGTYDYVDHHARRYGWLGIDAKKFSKTEIGSRRRGSDPEALADFRADTAQFLAEIRRVLKPTGWAALVVGDSTIGHTDVSGDQAVRSVATQAGLELIAWADEERDSFFARSARASRHEHLLLLHPSTKPRPVAAPPPAQRDSRPAQRNDSRSPQRPDSRPPQRNDSRPPQRHDSRPPQRNDSRPPQRHDSRPPQRNDSRPPQRHDSRPPQRPASRPPQRNDSRPPQRDSRPPQRLNARPPQPGDYPRSRPPQRPDRPRSPTAPPSRGPRPPTSGVQKLTPPRKPPRR